MNVKKEHRTKVDELKDALAKQKTSEKASESTAKESGGENLDDLTAQLSQAEEEAKAHYDKLLRAMAELDNFKKRTEREKSEMIKFGNEQIITDLLPVLDDMDRVFEHVPHGASKELVDFVSGVELMSKHLRQTLEKYGLKEIESEGAEFDPKFHEAVDHSPSKDVPADHIALVHRKGYMLHDRVLRAAMVSVSKG